MKIQDIRKAAQIAKNIETLNECKQSAKDSGSVVFYANENGFSVNLPNSTIYFKSEELALLVKNKVQNVLNYQLRKAKAELKKI